MKSCDYCGQANDDAAAVCAGCGTTAFQPISEVSAPPPGPKAMLPAFRLREITNDPVQLFRALVLLSTISYLVWFFHLLVGGSLLSQETWDALAWQGVGAWLTIPPSFAWLFLLVSVAVSVGLWSFSASARWVFAALSVFSVITSLLGGIQVQTALGSYLGTMAGMANGAILVMAYTPPLRQQFE